MVPMRQPTLGLDQKPDPNKRRRVPPSVGPLTGDTEERTGEGRTEMETTEEGEGEGPTERLTMPTSE